MQPALPAKPRRAPLLTYMAFESRVQGFVLKLIGKALVGEKASQASDSIGTLHFSHWVPFENNYIGFFTIYDGPWDQYMLDFATKTAFVWDALFPHIKGAPPPPVAKDVQAFQSALEKQLSGDRVLQRLSGPLGSGRSSPDGRPQVTRGHHAIAVCGTTLNEERRAGKAERNTRRNTMSQSHLTIDFPIKGPANAKALTKELPSLMPDFAKTQDQLGTVHFSRFMVKGDEKLLFLSDIDGEVDQHIERLVKSAGPVFDAIFTHVDDPPATPVAGNPQGVVKWLTRHVREPLDTYFAYEDASVQDIKASARAAGFTGKTSQGTLLTYMPFKSRVQGVVMKHVAKAVFGEKGHVASDAIGTLHFHHWVPFERQLRGLLHNLRRSLGEVHAGLRDKNLVRVGCPLSTCHGRAATPVAKDVQAFSRYLAENNYPAIGFYSAYPGLSVQDIRALMADRKPHSATAR